MQERTFTNPAKTDFPQTRPSFRTRHLTLRQLAPVLTVVVLIALWEIIALAKFYPPFIIPPPLDVLNKFLSVLADGTLWVHMQATLIGVLAGLFIGVILAIALGYAIAKNHVLESVLSPLIVSFQSAPVVAYAPLLVIWFDSGPTSKIVTSALIVFFPMLMNTIVGIRNVSPDLRDLMRSLQATRWQTFTRLEVPYAMPVLLSGLKVSATLAVIGAVVGEFINANAGLGFLVNVARSRYDTPLVIVAVLTLTIIARLLYSLVSLLERRLLSWQLRARRN